MEERVSDKGGEVIQTFGEGGKYGRLVASEDAKKIMEGFNKPSSLKPPKGRPAMFPTNDDAIANGLPDAMTDEKWDKLQKESRTIEVEVLCKPPPNSPFPWYRSAKMCWPYGMTKAMVSKAELEELQSEGEHRLTVTVLSNRPLQVQVPGGKQKEK